MPGSFPFAPVTARRQSPARAGRGVRGPRGPPGLAFAACADILGDHEHDPNIHAFAPARDGC